MTEQPLWRRQQDALAAESEARPADFPVPYSAFDPFPLIPRPVQITLTLDGTEDLPALLRQLADQVEHAAGTTIDERLGLPPRLALRPPTPEEVRAWVDRLPDVSNTPPD